MAALDCVTCSRPLPEGREHPQYFGQSSTGYTPERQAERAAEDVSSILQYAVTVNFALWTMLQVAEVKSPELMDTEHYLDEAKSLCFLLVDLVGWRSEEYKDCSGRLMN